MNGPRYGVGFGEDVGIIISRLFSNRGFLTKEDIKILEFLSKKGDYESKKAILIDKDIKDPINHIQEYMDQNFPKTVEKYKKLKLIVKN